MNIMSDAKLSQQDLYLLYVDFSSAFNTIDHVKLLCIMHDFGLPENAIEVIAELYTNAITKIRLYFARTGPIKIKRGTIKGNTLSPLLFLTYIEPLLRWLQSGGRGYKFGCLSKSMHADHTTSASAYADDMFAAALSATDLARQAEKMLAFENWSGMAVNVKKCVVTGILWGQARRNGSDKVLSSKMIEMLQQRLGMVKMCNTPIPFLHPHTPTDPQRRSTRLSTLQPCQEKVKKRKHEAYKQAKRKSRRSRTVSTEYKARQDLDEGDANETKLYNEYKRGILLVHGEDTYEKIKLDLKAPPQSDSGVNSPIEQYSKPLSAKETQASYQAWITDQKLRKGRHSLGCCMIRCAYRKTSCLLA